MLTDAREFPPHVQKVLSWARYLYWAELCRIRLLDEGDSLPDSQRCDPGWYRFALVCQWYGSEWVVIEGWQEAKFPDPDVNLLLQAYPDMLQMLRRFRNAVFHFQPRVWDSRVDDFMEAAEEHIPWLHFLHQEFLRCYWQITRAERPGVYSRDDLRTALKHVVGWVPYIERPQAPHLGGREVPSADHSNALDDRERFLAEARERLRRH